MADTRCVNKDLCIITHLPVLLSKPLSETATLSNHSHPGVIYLNITQVDTDLCNHVDMFLQGRDGVRS